MKKILFATTVFLLAALAAAFGQNNLRGVQETYSEQTSIFGRKHAWILGCLYTGTFGSFIGFAAAFPMLIAVLFPESGALKWAFAGPLAVLKVKIASITSVPARVTRRGGVRSASNS